MKRYRTICADPPWTLPGMRSRPRLNGRRPSRAPYDTMSTEAICALPVQEMAEDDAHLFLWVPVAFNREGIGSTVARAWGFEPLNEIIWRKPGFGLGKFPRPQHEILMVCKRGSLPFNVCDVGSVQTWAASQEHSAKPDGSFDLIEAASPGPYLELFARRARFSWSYWGNESLETVELGAA